MQSDCECRVFLHTLLIECIGTVMIEWEEWNFPLPSFDRGYLNSRLKQKLPVNTLTHQRLNRLFETVFTPGNREGRYQEPQAVETANSLIRLLQKYFHVDFSVWNNYYTKDNQASRSHLLACLDLVLALLEDQEIVPVDAVSDSLIEYMKEVDTQENMSASKYPRFLTDPPFRQTDHYVGRKTVASFLTGQLIKGHSCYLHGMGGLGKTEIAKSVLQEILNMPSTVSGFTHVMWVGYTDNSFEISLVRALHMEEELHNLEQRFQKAVSIINRYRERLLLVVDNVENADDENLLSVDQYLGCRILITSRCGGFSSFFRIPVEPLSYEECMELFYSYYHGQKDDIKLREIIDLADRHTVTVELLAKIADVEEFLLYELYDLLVRCDFNISEEEVASIHEKMHSEDRVIVQLTQPLPVFYAFCYCLCSPRTVSG